MVSAVGAMRVHMPPALLYYACWCVAGLTARCCFVADLVITHALEWPSLTVQWLPVSPAAMMASLR
jgi:hypothetical protein